MDPNVPNVPQVVSDNGWFSGVLTALLAAIGGGGLTKIIDRWFGHKNILQSRLKELEDRLHAQMQEETKALRNEIRGLRNELDEWKRRYFELLEKKGELEVALKAANRDLADCEEESAELRRKLDHSGREEDAASGK